MLLESSLLGEEIQEGVHWGSHSSGFRRSNSSPPYFQAWIRHTFGTGENDLPNATILLVSARNHRTLSKSPQNKAHNQMKKKKKKKRNLGQRAEKRAGWFGSGEHKSSLKRNRTLNAQAHTPSTPSFRSGWHVVQSLSLHMWKELLCLIYWINMKQFDDVFWSKPESQLGEEVGNLHQAWVECGRRMEGDRDKEGRWVAEGGLSPQQKAPRETALCYSLSFFLSLALSGLKKFSVSKIKSKMRDAGGWGGATHSPWPSRPYVPGIWARGLYGLVFSASTTLPISAKVEEALCCIQDPFHLLKANR